MPVNLRARTAPVRCAYCHGDDATLLGCLSCGAGLHAECFPCPTLGCQSTRVERAWEPRTRKSKEPKVHAVELSEWPTKMPVEGLGARDVLWGVAFYAALLLFLSWLVA